jgi:hypothetical protein
MRGGSPTASVRRRIDRVTDLAEPLRRAAQPLPRLFDRVAEPVGGPTILSALVVILVISSEGRSPCSPRRWRPVTSEDPAYAARRALARKASAMNRANARQDASLRTPITGPPRAGRTERAGERCFKQAMLAQFKRREPSGEHRAAQRDRLTKRRLRHVLSIV